VAAATWLRLPLSRGEWLGVGAVTLGLVALGLSAGDDAVTDVPTWAKWLPLALSLLLIAGSMAAARIPGRLGVTVLGSIAGFGFGLVGIATRTLDQPLSLTGILTDPAAYGIVASGGLALLALATALQRGAVTAATAAMVVAETVIPSAVGLAFLGDRIRPGYQAVAAIGLVVAIGGSVALARLGELPPTPATEPANPI
jgi:drug/metabolite transporter (DMT)-like permease